MDKKNIQVIKGTGKNLNISPVFDHLPSEKPKKPAPKKIIIPETKNK